MKNIPALIFVSGLLLVGIYDLAVGNDEKTQGQKDKHYALPGLDHGLLQSPINILSAQSKTGKHNVTFKYKDEINKVKNLGHTVQLDFAHGNTITFDNKTYEFKQLHFHTPSEHLIDGITYPMEMHIVNTLTGQNKGDIPEYFVMAFHFKMGKENKFISEFINLIPKDANQTQDIVPGIIKLKDLFDQNPREEITSYYHYKGSLTTPPFTESVHWYVLKKIFDASPEQIRQINQIEGDNARHIQARYGRAVK